MDTMYTDDMDTSYTPKPDATDSHGRTSADFDNDCGDYVPASQGGMRAGTLLERPTLERSPAPHASLSQPNLTHGAAYRDALVSRYLRK